MPPPNTIKEKLLSTIHNFYHEHGSPPIALYLGRVEYKEFYHWFMEQPIYKPEVVNLTHGSNTRITFSGVPVFIVDDPHHLRCS